MSASVSLATGRPYGVARTCTVLGFARSSFYAQSRRGRAEGTSTESRRPGPAPELSDAALLVRIRTSLDESLFVGEGHRPVWARLRFDHGVNVSRKRVLRLLREHHLLSPNRAPRGEPKTHEGRITTDRPDEIWATDGTNVHTVEDGKVWLFVAVDHFNAECVGAHVCKYGDRFAALQPIAQGLQTHRASTERDAGRGITMRQDHGTQYTSESYRDQVKAWGMALSFALVGEPETNGVAERFIRTLKEQVVYGRAYRGVEDLRAAVALFVERYNRAWRVGKLNFKTPTEARLHALNTIAPIAA